MVILNTKTLEELTSESLKELQAVGFTTKPGGIARLFLNIINKHISSFYKTLTINHLRAFLSTSDGDALDAIGALLQCRRLNGELDEDYKYRISKQCLTLATANKTAVRLAALSTNGVDDVVLKPYAMGSGTFTVIVITDPTVNTDTVIETVKLNVEETVGYGIRYQIVAPTNTFVKLKVKLYINDSVSDSVAQEIRYNVQLALSNYFSELKVGEDILIDRITQTIMNTSSDIVSYQALDFRINGEKALYINQSCRWFERFALNTDIDNIVIS